MYEFLFYLGLGMALQCLHLVLLVTFFDLRKVKAIVTRLPRPVLFGSLIMGVLGSALLLWAIPVLYLCYWVVAEIITFRIYLSK